jgi:glycosyltransferase involved in cell wall biosynthesis
MKIGIDARAARWYRGTGIGTYTYQLVYNLNLIDSKNPYLLFWPEENYSDIHPGDNFSFKLINEQKKDNFWDEVDIPNILTDTGIEVYHVPQNGIGLPDKKSCPFTITLHDVIPYKLPETVGPNYLKIFLEKIPRIVKAADAIITVSEYSKRDIAETLGIPLPNIYVTHLSAENIYYPMDRNTAKHLLLRKYEINYDFILYLGGFSPRKNIKGLIEAYYKIYKKLSSPQKLLIVGKHGKSYDDYRELVSKLGMDENILFTGFIPVNDLPLFYNGASLFVYPSFYEGFGLPPLEAMACATPTITSNVTSIPEIVDGCAMTINPYDTDELAEAMHIVLEDKKLWEHYSYIGFKKSREYSWKQTAKETLDVLLKVGQSAKGM